MVLLKGSGGSSFAAKLDARDRAVYERCTPVQRYLWEEKVALRSSLAGEEADIFDELAPARRTAFLRPEPVEASGGRSQVGDDGIWGAATRERAGALERSCM